MPLRDQFAYTIDNLAAVLEEFTTILGLSKYALYVQDYGAPVGYRLAARHPNRRHHIDRQEDCQPNLSRV